MDNFFCSRTKNKEVIKKTIMKSTDPNDYLCHTCSGTGEGIMDGECCSVCKGRGYILDDDFDCIEPDEPPNDPPNNWEP